MYVYMESIMSYNLYKHAIRTSFLVLYLSRIDTGSPNKDEQRRWFCWCCLKIDSKLLSSDSYFSSLCGKHLYDDTNSLRGKVWCHITSFTTPPFTNLPVPSQNSEQTCIFVIGVSILSLFLLICIEFRDIFDSMVFCFCFIIWPFPLIFFFIMFLKCKSLLVLRS